MPIRNQQNQNNQENHNNQQNQNNQENHNNQQNQLNLENHNNRQNLENQQDQSWVGSWFNSGIGKTHTEESTSMRAEVVFGLGFLSGGVFAGNIKNSNLDPRNFFHRDRPNDGGGGGHGGGHDGGPDNGGDPNGGGRNNHGVNPGNNGGGGSGRSNHLAQNSLSQSLEDRGGNESVDMGQNDDYALNYALRFLKQNFPNETVRRLCKGKLLMYSLGHLKILNVESNSIDIIERKFMTRSLRVFESVIKDYDNFYQNKLLVKDKNSRLLEHSSLQLRNCKFKLPNVVDSKIFSLRISGDKTYPLMELFYVNSTNEFIRNHLDWILREFQCRNKDNIDNVNMQRFFEKEFKPMLLEKSKVKNRAILNNDQEECKENIFEEQNNNNLPLGSNVSIDLHKNKSKKNMNPSSIQHEVRSDTRIKPNVNNKLGSLIFSTISIGKTNLSIDLSIDTLRIFGSVMREYQTFYSKGKDKQDLLTHSFKQDDSSTKKLPRLPNIQDSKYFDMIDKPGPRMELRYNDNISSFDGIYAHLNGIMNEFKFRIKGIKDSNLNNKIINAFQSDIGRDILNINPEIKEEYLYKITNMNKREEREENNDSDGSGNSGDSMTTHVDPTDDLKLIENNSQNSNDSSSDNSMTTHKDDENLVILTMDKNDSKSKKNNTDSYAWIEEYENAQLRSMNEKTDILSKYDENDKQFSLDDLPSTPDENEEVESFHGISRPSSSIERSFTSSSSCNGSSLGSPSLNTISLFPTDSKDSHDKSLYVCESKLLETYMDHNSVPSPSQKSFPSIDKGVIETTIPKSVPMGSLNPSASGTSDKIGQLDPIVELN